MIVYEGVGMAEQQDEDRSVIFPPVTTIRLSERDSAIFIEALRNPPKPNERLRAAVADYHALFGKKTREAPTWAHELEEMRVALQENNENPVVEQVMATVEAQYGERLDNKDRAVIRTGIARNLTNTEALAAYPLVNGDEPGSVFRAYRGE